ncbi:MAG: cohesin domain-containing protein [Candidatus Roizmanbacteria bacterium]|nr:cohesin domain-containing protein [Candidatus Roizmanbacteria bacterium]
MRILRLVSIYFFICLFAFLFVTLPVEAASLKFDQGTVTVGAGSTFTLNAVIDAGSDQITSTDMWILYDSTLLEAQSASAAAYFPAVTNNITAGKIYIAGLVTDPGTYKTGVGNVATITFKGLKNGQATITYDCRADVSNSSKVIKNAVDPTNVINCAQNGTSIVTIGTGGTATSLTPTVYAPTSVYSPQTQPTALPQTGIMDEMPKLFIAGGIFVMVGIMMRILLVL